MEPNTGTSQPISISGAVAGVLSTGVALAAIFWPDRLDPIAQAAIIGFGNSVIIAAAVIWAQARTTSLAKPRLPENTVVQVLDKDTGQITGDTVTMKKTPPGPTSSDG